ncbi:MAG TPA: putative HNHc nuclease [Xanthomonadaceae bacterium]|nr:putative HNHc nuclease [Xanthomonadaceae bacterium]
MREHPCCVCGEPTTVEAHHPRVSVVGDGGPGMAQKASDKWAVALCGRHHRELHSMGEGEFWASYGISPMAVAIHYGRRP